MIFFILTLLMVVFESNKLSTLETSNENNLTLANNNLAFKLHKSFNSRGNAFSSPISVFTALGMLYAGANGVTAQEIRHVLSYDTTGLNKKDLNQYFQRMFLSFTDSPDKGTLHIANALISQDKYPIVKEYKDVLKNYYGAMMKEVDFMTETTKAVDEINSWVRNKTKGKITKLLESLNHDTLLVLLNAVYFKGKWKFPFHSTLTRKQLFYNSGKDAVTVPMMIQENNFFHETFPQLGFQALKLPYLGDRFSMILIVPFQRNGLPAVEEKLTSNVLDNIVTDLKERNVIIKLPKFKLEDSRELKHNLATLGMKSAFTDNANFGGINRDANLKVSKILHKAVINVYEGGTEASGATVIVVSPRAFQETSHFFVEHPFLFLIIDDANGMILFYGRVNEL